MRRKKRIFIEKIEGIPISFFERRYKDLVKEKLKNKFGVYALYDKKGRLYYVGIAQHNIAGRIKQHLKNKHEGKWQFFSVYFTKKQSVIKILEDAFISMVLPKGNIQKPTKINKGNKQIINEMKRIDKKQRMPMSSSRGKRKKSHAKRSKKKNRSSLKNYFEKSRPLMKSYKGKTYKAILLKSGKIKYKNKKYNTPSAAAKVIVSKRAPNSGFSGWNFWSVKTLRGNWIKLRDLKN